MMKDAGDQAGHEGDGSFGHGHGELLNLIQENGESCPVAALQEHDFRTIWSRRAVPVAGRPNTDERRARRGPGRQLTRMLPKIMAATKAAARAQNLVSNFAGDLSDAKVPSLSEILIVFNRKYWKNEEHHTHPKNNLQI